MHDMLCIRIKDAFALHAAGLGAVVTADMAPNHPHLAVAQRKLQGSCAALVSVEGFLHSSVTAAIAAAVVQVSPSFTCPVGGWVTISFGRGQNIKPAGLVPGRVHPRLLLEPGPPITGSS